MTCALFAALVLLAAAGASGSAAVRTDLYGDPLPPGAVARLGTVRLRHSDEAVAVAFTADSTHLISCACDGEVRVWDVATGERVRQKRLSWVPADPKASALFSEEISLSPDGTTAARGGETVYWYDTRTGAELGRLPANHYRYSNLLIFSPDGKKLLVQKHEDEDRTSLELWDLLEGKKRGTLSNPCEQSYRLDERTVGEPPMSWLTKAHAAFAPDGERMTVWLGKQVGIEEIATRCLLATLPQGVGAPLVFSPDGRLVAAAILRPKQDPSDGDDVMGLSLIEAASGTEVFRYKVEGFKFAAFAPDSRSVVVVDEKRLHVWDTSTGARLHEMAWPRSILNARGEAKIDSLVVLPDGRAATGMTEGDILIWDLAEAARPVRRQADALDRKKLDILWSDLAGQALSAYRALDAMTAMPAQAVPYLNDRLHPVVLDTTHIEKLLADLDGEQYEAREAASQELTRIVYRAEPLLRRALEGRPSPEMRRRLQAILAEPKRPSAEALRTLRAIAVLERIGTPEARRVLEKLSGGAEAREAREAKAALARLKRLTH